VLGNGPRPASSKRNRHPRDPAFPGYGDTRSTGPGPDKEQLSAAFGNFFLHSRSVRIDPPPPRRSQTGSTDAEDEAGVASVGRTEPGGQALVERAAVLAAGSKVY